MLKNTAPIAIAIIAFGFACLMLGVVIGLQPDLFAGWNLRDQ